MKRILLIYIPLFVLTQLGPAMAASSKCDDHGVLREMDHYSAKWEWGGHTNSIRINVWDSPAHIAIVGTVLPGAYVDIIGEKGGYYLIRTIESQGKVTGWIKKEEVESFLPKKDVQPYECG